MGGNFVEIVARAPIALQSITKPNSFLPSTSLSLLGRPWFSSISRPKQHLEANNRKSIVMVVVSTLPSTSSTTQKKNRRKLHKKRTGDVEVDERIQQQPSAKTDRTQDDEDDALMIDVDAATIPLDTSAPLFPELPASAQRATLKSETRRVAIPPHRMTPLKKEWVNIFGPLTEILGLQVRMNVPRRSVEIRVCIMHDLL